MTAKMLTAWSLLLMLTTLSASSKAMSCAPGLHNSTPVYLNEVSGSLDLIPYGIQMVKSWMNTIFADIRDYSGQTFKLEVPFDFANFTRGIWTHQQFFAFDEFNEAEQHLMNELDRKSDFGAHEEGAWVIRPKKGKLLSREVTREAETPLNQVGNELPALNALLHEHRLKLKDIESISFFHRHPGSGVLLSPEDICMVDDLAQEMAKSNPDLTVHIFALAALDSQKVVSHYGRKASSANSIVYAPFVEIEKARDASKNKSPRL